MKAGYIAELKKRKKEVDTCKANLEAWYALRLSDELMVGEEKIKFDKLLNLADTSISNANGTMATIKKAAAP